jgi:hypothetical protein
LDFSPLDSGSTVSIATTQQGTLFQATAIDPNVQDSSLVVRWTIDYPPYTATTWAPPTTPLPLSTLGQGMIEQYISCSINNLLAPTADSKHSLQLLVANRNFVANSCSASDPNCLDEIEGGGPVARANWTIVMACPAMMP